MANDLEETIKKDIFSTKYCGVKFEYVHYSNIDPEMDENFKKFKKTIEFNQKLAETDSVKDIFQIAKETKMNEEFAVRFSYLAEVRKWSDIVLLAAMAGAFYYFSNEHSPTIDNNSGHFATGVTMIYFAYDFIKTDIVKRLFVHGMLEK
jgi:hypothetical protein